MKQALLKGKDLLEVVGAAIPECPPDGVVVAMQAAAICRTDIKMLRKGQKDLVLPRVLGHEGAGWVVESDNPKLPAGTGVAVYPGIFCGKCSACASGQTGRCRDIGVLGFSEDGLFRAFVPFRKEELLSLVPIHAPADPLRIVLAEPLACCINAISKFNLLNRDIALVIGAGAVGGLFAALLNSMGFGDVYVAERDPLRLAREMPTGVKPLDVSCRPLAEILKHTGIDGQIDFMVAACSGGLAWPFWEAMKTGGSVSLFSGNDPGDAISPIDLNILHYRELSLAGAYGCNLADFQRAIDLLIAEAVDISFLKPCRLDLAQFMTGIEMLERQQIKKVIITQF